MTQSQSHETDSQLSEQNNVIHVLHGCPIFLKTSNSITEFFFNTPPSPIPSTISIEERPPWFYNSGMFKVCLKTFLDVWNIPFVTPDQMAKAGFIYKGVQDYVECMYCSKVFNNWQPGIEPYEEHKRQSPYCIFFNEAPGYDECGVYSYTCPSSLESNHKLKKMQDVLNTFGVMQTIRAPVHKEFLTFDARFSSFDKCLIEFEQDKDALCKAGFFYAGDGTNDHVLCFYCSQGLKDWEENDDPWIEHARWSKTCSFVLLNKGKKFVDKIVGVKNNITELNKMESSELMIEEEDTSIFDNCMKDSTTERTLDDHLKMSDKSQTKILSEGKLLLSQKQVNITLSDSMTCIVCRVTAIEVAFIPCCHTACIQCTLELLCFERPCPICRMPFSMTMRIYLTMEEVKNQWQLQCSSSQCLDEKLDPMFCKVCHKEKMKSAFLPCKHVYACVKCAAKMQKCPVCTEAFWATIQVYF